MDKEMIKTQENNIDQVQGEYEEVEIEAKEVRTDSYFDGGLLELIGWRILAFLVTGITLGIATPWAKCMLYSWEYKHTVLNGKRLKFEGTGGELFVQYIKWIFFTIITFGFYLLVLPVRKTRWIVENLHFEDEALTNDESYFDGNTIQLIGVNILCNILTAISLGLLFPFTVCYKRKWICKHTVINRKKIVFRGKATSLWGKYILWVFLTIITFGIYGLWLPIKMLKWQTKNTHIKRVGEIEEPKDNSLLIVITAIILVVLVVGPSVSLILRGIRNSKVVKGIEKSVTQVINPTSDNDRSKNSTSSGKKTIIYRTKSSFNPNEKTVKKKTTTKKKKANSSKNNTEVSNAIAMPTN